MKDTQNPYPEAHASEPANSYEVAYAIWLINPMVNTGISPLKVQRALSDKRREEIRNWAFTKGDRAWVGKHV